MICHQFVYNQSWTKCMMSSNFEILHKILPKINLKWLDSSSICHNFHVHLKCLKYFTSNNKSTQFKYTSFDKIILRCPINKIYGFHLFNLASKLIYVMNLYFFFLLLMCQLHTGTNFVNDFFSFLLFLLLMILTAHRKCWLTEIIQITLLLLYFIY